MMCFCDVSTNMITPSNERFSALLALCEWKPLVHWIPLTKASDVELWCFLWSAPEQTLEQTIEMRVIWDAIMLIMTSLYGIGGVIDIFISSILTCIEWHNHRGGRINKNLWYSHHATYKNMCH